METDETQNKTTCDSSNTHEWQRMIQAVIAQIDESIKAKDDDALSLSKAAETLGYSEFHFSKKFREISGMAFRDYLRYRRLAFALKEIRDTKRSILDIALEYGFSSHEAFTRAFKEAYSVSPKNYRKNPVPVVLRTLLRPFDCYLLSTGEKTMTKTHSQDLQDLQTDRELLNQELIFLILLPFQLLLSFLLRLQSKQVQHHTLLKDYAFQY